MAFLVPECSKYVDVGYRSVKGIFSYISVQGAIPHDIELWLIFFWAGFAPSIWLWLYVVALFATRALLRSENSSIGFDGSLTSRRTHSGQSAQWPPRWRLLCPLELSSCLLKFLG